MEGSKRKLVVLYRELPPLDLGVKIVPQLPLFKSSRFKLSLHRSDGTLLMPSFSTTTPLKELQIKFPNSLFLEDELEGGKS